MRIVLISCIVLTSVANLVAHNLELNLVEGETYYHSTTAHTAIEQVVSGQQVKISMEISGITSYYVIDRKKDYFNLKVRFVLLSMKMESPYGRREYTSQRKDLNDLYSELLSDMTQHEFNIKLNKDGTVQEISNLDDLFSGLLKGSNAISSDERAQIIEQLKQTYGEEALKGNIEMITAFSPGRDVKIDETWKTQIQLRSGIAATVSNEYRLKKYTKEYAIIDGSSQTVTDDKESLIQMNGMPTKYILNGTMKSTIKVDSRTGWIVEANIDQSFKGTVEIQDNPKLPGGTSLPIDFNSTMRVTNK